MSAPRRRYRRPSSTITAATLASMGMTVLFELLMQFGIEVRQTLVAASVAFVAALAGYFKAETVLPIRRDDDAP